MRTFIFVLLICCSFVSFAADENLSILKFNCIDRENSPEKCERESLAVLAEMGCSVRNELPHTECVKLTDDTLCKVYSANCQKMTRASGKLSCPAGFSRAGSVASKTAIFETSYFCKMDGPSAPPDPTKPN